MFEEELLVQCSGKVLSLSVVSLTVQFVWKSIDLYTQTKKYKFYYYFLFLFVYLSKKKNSFCYMQLGALAVVIRQTNIVWMLFVACTGVINITLAHRRDIIEVNDVDIAIKKPNRSTSNDSVTLGSNLRRRKFSSSLDTDKHSMPSATFFSANHPSGLLVFNLLCNCVMLWKLLIKKSYAMKVNLPD